MAPAEVKAARKQLGLTQAQLAERLRLSPTYGKDVIRSWESGRRPISGPAQVAIEMMLLDPARALKACEGCGRSIYARMGRWCGHCASTNPEEVEGQPSR